MNYRRALLLAAEDLGASGTKTIDIDVDQPISKIDIKFKTTKSKSGMDAGPPANLTKIELVDGSTPIVSLTGYEVQALGYYNNPGSVLSHGQHTIGNSEEDEYPLQFGRYLWDPELAFLPSRFKNPQLKITFDEDLADTGVTANEMEIVAHIFDEKAISPSGFLRGIEWFDYTVGANNSYETILLPEDNPIRQILVRAYRDGFEPWNQIDEARFDENLGSRVPWEYSNLENYFRRMKSEWGQIVYPMQVLGSVAGHVHYVPTTQYYSQFVGVQASGTGDPFVAVANGRGGKLTVEAGSTIVVDGLVVGHLPWHCYQFPMGLKDEIGDWYDPQGKKPRLRLRAAASGTSGTGQVVLEQLVRY